MKKVSLIGLMALLTVVCFAQGDHVPAYNNHALNSGDALPILPRDQLWENRSNTRTRYTPMSSHPRFRTSSYQLPCYYCFCERIGFKSLHTPASRAHTGPIVASV